MKKSYTFCFVILTIMTTSAIINAQNEKSCSAEASLQERNSRKLQTTIVDAARYNSRGVSYASESRLQEAAICFQLAVERDPNLTEPYINLGIIQLRRGEYPAALESFGKAWRLDEKSTVAAAGAGEVYFKLEQYEESAKWTERAIRLAPGNPEYLSNLGITYFYLGKYEKSAALFQEALKLRPGSAKILNDLGVACIALGKTGDALRMLEKAIELQPDFSGAYNNLGVANTVQKKFQKALAAFQEASRLNPSWSLAKYNLGIAYLNAGDKQSAVEIHRTLQLENSELARKLFHNIYRDKIVDASEMRVNI